MKSIRPFAILVCAIVAACSLAGCNGNATSSVASLSSEGSSSSIPVEYREALSGEGLVSTFIGSDVTDAKVASDEDAEAVVASLVERMGGDDTTNLELVQLIPVENGNSYYIFQQQAGGVMVYGASAKLIVNANHDVVGLVSDILPHAKTPSLEEVAVTQEEAEKAVVDVLAQNGVNDPKAVSEYTVQTIVPISEDAEQTMLAWVVYVNVGSSKGADQSWLASYVNVGGDYMYSVPVSEPNNPEALRAESTEFDFDAYDQKDMTFTVEKDGSSAQVTVPVLVDKQTGAVAFLGDAKRKILCADYAQFNDDGKVASPFEDDGVSFNEMDVAVYENFLRIWDLFAQMSWKGPDGVGSPTLLLMNAVTSTGEPDDNCYYLGARGGWESFAFGRSSNNGLATDIVAHEFVHCLTGTTMTTNLYYNETGAINESMSDILGNLTEMELDGDEGAWVMGEKTSEGGIRDFANPNRCAQPAYRWDVYYIPGVAPATEMNDMGGVHINSSLLNIVSYKLNEAGMTCDEQFTFWLNVALAMVPTTDYAQMAELLPWVLEQTGYGQYADALNRSIADAGYTAQEKPSALPDGAGSVEFAFPNVDAASQGQVRATFVSTDKVDSDDDSSVWGVPEAETGVVSASLPAGDYYAVVWVGDDPDNADSSVYNSGGWASVDEYGDVSEKGEAIHVEEGQSVTLTSKGLE